MFTPKDFVHRLKMLATITLFSFSEKCPPSERDKGVCRTAGTNCECLFYVLLKKESVRCS